MVWDRQFLHFEAITSRYVILGNTNLHKIFFQLAYHTTLAMEAKNAQDSLGSLLLLDVDVDHLGKTLELQRAGHCRRARIRRFTAPRPGSRKVPRSPVL